MRKAHFGIGVCVSLLWMTVLLADGDPASAAKACARKKFETRLVQDACGRGGQDDAKKAMKAFLKEAKRKERGLGCASCHAKVGGDYPLKPDGLQHYKQLGGS